MFLQKLLLKLPFLVELNLLKPLLLLLLPLVIHLLVVGRSTPNHYLIVVSLALCSVLHCLLRVQRALALSSTLVMVAGASERVS